MLFARKKNIYLYESCSELPYYNFYRIIETKNLLYLVIGWNERDEVLVDEEKTKNAWTKIYSEYNKLRDDNKLLAYIDICTEITYLENKSYIVACLISVLVQDTENRDRYKVFAKEIKSWGYNMDVEGDIVEECLKVQNAIKGLSNKIRLLNFEKDAFYGEHEEEISLYKQVVKIEQALNRNEVDPKRISVEKWVYMIEEIKEITEQRKKAS